MKRSNPVNNVVAYATHIIFTGSPRSRCSPAMTKSTVPSSPPLEGCRAAAGWSENARNYCHTAPHPPRSGGVVRECKKLLPHCPTPSLLSLRAQRSNPVNYARAYARLYYDWIATVALLPRDTLIEHNKKYAQRRGGQRMQETIATLPHTLSLVIASAAKQSSNLCRRTATQHLHFEPCTLHFIKTGHTCPVFIQSIRVWWRQYLLCPLHCAITRRRGFQTIYIDVVRGVGRQIFS